MESLLLSQRQRIILDDEGSIVLPIRAVATSHNNNSNNNNSNNNNPIIDTTGATIRSIRIHRLVLRPIFVAIFIFILLSILNNKQEGGGGRSFFRHHSKAYYSTKQTLHPPYWTRHIPKTTTTSKEEKEEVDDDDLDPQTLGWTPNLFPNPKIEPHKCGIQYLVETNPYFQGRLCDPDWVLGGVYLEQISLSMADFRRQFSNNNFYGTGDENRDFLQQQADSYGEFFSVEEETTTTTQEDDDDIHDHTKEVMNNNTKGTVVSNNNNNSGEMAAVDEDEGALASSLVDGPVVELAVATVRKMNVHAVLEQGSYYTYEDEDDMVNDAAQIFARYLHAQWWEQQDNNNNNNNKKDKNNNTGENGILIFLSIQDRVCFISTGSTISTILPWWRLEHIVSSMKPDLRHRDYGHALLTAINDLSEMLEAGPPTMADRVHDFMARFGVVIAFAMFTFIFGAWGELRERRKRWQYAESRSKLTPFEREKARSLQREFKSRSCPICLENFDYGEDLFLGEIEEDTAVTIRTTTTTTSTQPSLLPSSSSSNLKRVDSYGIPLCGGDKKKIKLLRCGHIFCESCWKAWIHSGHGNPCICPVCRQDVGKSSKNNSRRRRRNEQETSSSPTTATEVNSEDYDATPLISNASTSRRHRDGGGGSSRTGGDGVNTYSYDAMGEWIGRYSSSSSSSSSYNVMGVTSSRLQSTEEEETEIGEEGDQYSDTAIQISLSEPREAHGYFGLGGQSPPSQLQQQLQQQLQREEGQQEEDTVDETISLLSNDMRRRGWFSR